MDPDKSNVTSHQRHQFAEVLGKVKNADRLAWKEIDQVMDGFDVKLAWGPELLHAEEDYRLFAAVLLIQTIRPYAASEEAMLASRMKVETSREVRLLLAVALYRHKVRWHSVVTAMQEALGHPWVGVIAVEVAKAASTSRQVRQQFHQPREQSRRRRHRR